MYASLLLAELSLLITDPASASSALPARSLYAHPTEHPNCRTPAMRAIYFIYTNLLGHLNK